MNRDHQVLWELSKDTVTTACVMVSCCAGAELQILRSTGSGDEEIVLRELYPDRDSLYERARLLRNEARLDLTHDPDRR
jgi:hypothetical protein